MKLETLFLFLAVKADDIRMQKQYRKKGIESNGYGTVHNKQGNLVSVLGEVGWVTEMRGCGFVRWGRQNPPLFAFDLFSFVEPQ